jgi:hypothetical protein
MGLRARPVRCISIRIKENCLFKSVNLSLDLMSLQMRFELSQVVNGTLSVGSSDNICGVLPDVPRNFTPSRFNGSNRVSQCAILSGCR